MTRHPHLIGATSGLINRPVKHTIRSGFSWNSFFRVSFLARIKANLMSLSLSHTLAAAALTLAANSNGEGFAITRFPDVPDTHGFAGAFAGVYHNHLLAGGGANFPDGVMPWDGGKKVWHDRLFALDLTQSEAKWSEIGRLPMPNGYGVSLTVKEGVVMIGGGDASRNFTEVTLLTLDAHSKPSFRNLPALPCPLAQMAGAAVGRRIHIIGGIEKPDSTAASSKHWLLDLDALDKGWQSQPAPPAPARILATAAAIGDSFYLMAGCSLAPDSHGKPARAYLRDAWKFTNGQWSQLPDLPRASVASASPAPVAGHSFYVVSGDDGVQIGLSSPKDHKGFTKEVLRFNTDSNIWSKCEDLTISPPVTLAVAPWKDAVIFFNGEVRPGVRTTQVFSFQPIP